MEGLVKPAKPHFDPMAFLAKAAPENGTKIPRKRLVLRSGSTACSPLMTANAQADGGCSNPTGFDRPSIRQRWRQKEFVSRESAV
jgi:hypothetical protein